MDKIIVIIIVILFIMALYGNIGLLFMLFHPYGGSALEGHEASVLVAVIVDIALFFYILYKISNKIEANAKEKEKKRLESIETQINEIKSKYSPKELPVSINGARSQVSFDRLYINTEINKAVSEFKKRTSQLIGECKTVDQKINKFLSYNSDPD